jgi:hypothetical protein
MSIWDAALVLFWFAGIGLGLKLWVYLLRPARSWYYSPTEGASLTVRAGVALVTAVVIGLAGIPVVALGLVLGGVTVIVIIIMAPVTLIAYRDKLDRGMPRVKRD